MAITLWGMQIVCVEAVVIAFVRTEEASFARTTTLAILVSLLSGLALHNRVRVYRAMRRRALFMLGPTALTLGALVVDGVSHSPMSYPAAVTVGMTAFVGGRRWALAAATLIAAGAIAAGTLNAGVGALSSVGQGAAGYFAWALVCAGLAESFVLLMMRLPQVAPSEPWRRCACRTLRATPTRPRRRRRPTHRRRPRPSRWRQAVAAR